MLRCVPRAAALIVVLFGASCFLLPPLEAQAQDQPYSAPIVLQLTIPGAAEPITVTAQIAVALPTGAGSSQPSMLPVTITQAAASQGSVKVISAAPAQPAARPPAAALTAEAEPTAGMLPTPTPQTAAAAPTPTPQPLAGAVNNSANLRTGPGTSYAVAGKAQAGDAASVVGRSADGEWYKLAGGEWIAAFLVDIEDANGLPLADAPSAADSWPRYEMISGAFSFAHPPELETYDESADTVFLSQGDVYGVTLGVSHLAAAADFNLLDSEAAVRAYKLFLTSNADLSFRF